MGNPGDDPIYRNSDADMPSFVGISTFLQSPLIQTSEGLRERGVEVAIMGAPFDMGVVNRPGARFGPRAIRQAGYFGAPNDDLYHMGLQVYPTDILSVADFGDANCPPSSLERSHEAIQTKVSECLKAGALPIVVGGDHSITLPSATAVSNHYGPGKATVWKIDPIYRHLWRCFSITQQPHEKTYRGWGCAGEKFCPSWAPRLLATTYLV